MQKERSGFLSMAVGLTLILVGFSLWEYKDFNLPYMEATPQSQTAGALSSGNQNNPPPAGGYEIYQSSQYGFSIQYPNDFVLKQSTNGAISFNVPAKNYFHTVLVGNDSDIQLTIPAPAANCPAAPEAPPNGTPTSTINSPAGSFQKISGSGVGAGQLYDQLLYTLTSKGLCYAVQLTLHSTDGAGFYYNDPQQIAATDAEQARDKAAFFKLIDKMVSTFALTK